MDPDSESRSVSKDPNESGSNITAQVGILSLHPALAANSEDVDMMNGVLPPPSLVPRLHVLSFKQVNFLTLK